MQALLLSNSTMPGTPFLSWAKPHINEFLGDVPLRICFIPEAVVTTNLDEYATIVSDIFAKYGHKVTSIHNHENPKELVKQSDVVMVSGGNSFHLLNRLYEMDLVALIRAEVESGTKYVGWSAGSNVASPTIMTTNDMPITQPPTFDAIGLIPWQINPHYTEKTIEGHGGESRGQRLKEYLAMNPETVVLAMREGCGLRIEGEAHTFFGTGGVILQHNEEAIQFGEEALTINDND